MAVYTRQSSTAIVDGGVIEAVDLNNEFDQLAAAFLAPTFGVGTSGADIVLTFDGETNDGILTWMEDEDYFLFSDDLLLATTEKIQFRDTGLYINSSADGQLDIVADTEVQIAATTIDINGAVALSGAITGATNITLSGELDAATLDISGNADIDGTLEADAITIGGTAIGSIYSAIAGSSSIVTTGALDSGSITSGFGTVDTGASTITTTGLISGGSLDIDNVLINGTTIGHTDDTDLMTLADGTLTVAGDVVVSGDLTITGDDLVMGTNTSGHILVADGTNFNPKAVGDLSEISTAADGDLFLAVDASGGGLKKITRSAVIAGTGASGDLANVVEDTSPQLGGNLDTNSQNILIDDAHFIADESGNEQIIFQTTGSAVNQIDITNAASGSGPSIAATGDDTNINLTLTPKGSGKVVIDGNGSSGGVSIDDGVIDIRTGTGNEAKILFYCESSNAHAQTLKAAPHSAGSSATLVLPTASGTLIGTGDTGTLPLAVIDIDGATDIGADIADADLFIIDDAAGGTNRKVAASRIKTYIGSSVAADDIAAGDGAITLTTSSGNIVIDAAANDSDIILKGTDGGADTTFLTIDGSAAGAATFNDKIIATELDISGDVDVDGTLEADAITINGTAIASVLSPIAGGSGIVTTGAINSGSITSGFGTIDTGASAITTTGLISGGSLDIDNVLINGTTIGHTDDTDLITVADSLLTIDGDVTITGATPTLIIGDAGAEDAKIVFDGNAQDFYIGLDDSADDLVIGKGSALGTTPAISITEALKTQFGGAAVGKTLTDTSNTGSITLDFDASQNFVLTFTGNVTLANPSTESVGQTGIIVIIQDGTGSRTLSIGTDYEFPAGTAPTISTAANTTDIIPYCVVAANRIALGAPQLAFATPS